VEFVTRDASIQPDRYRFANLDELTPYLGQVLGGQSEGRGIRGSMSRKGTYSRRDADGTQAVTFGDPMLDAISSAAGAARHRAPDDRSSGGPRITGGADRSRRRCGLLRRAVT
jgi:hypothetical protein